MKEAFKKAGLKNSNMVTKDVMLENIINNIESNKGKFKKKKYQYKLKVCFSIIIILCLSSATVYAFSPEFRELLANKLHIVSSNTHLINSSNSNNGITMTVGSTHVTGKTAVILLTFSKDNDNPFDNSVAPDQSKVMINGEENTFISVDSGLSDDKKTILSYCTLSSNDILEDKEITIKISNLFSNQSSVENVEYKDEKITGEWIVSFKVLKDSNDTISLENTNPSETIEMCGKRLEVNNVSLSSTLLIAYTTTLSDSASISPSLNSSKSPKTGAYYDVYIKIIYNDGTEINTDCILDEDNNIVAIFPDGIILDKVQEIDIGDITIQL